MAIKKTHRNDCEQSRDATKTKRWSNDYEQSNAHSDTGISKKRQKHKWTGKLKKVDSDFQHAQSKMKTWKEKEEEDSNTTTSMEMCHCIWEKLKEKAKTAAAAIKRATLKIMKAEAAHWRKWRMEAKAKWKRRSKDMCGDSTGKKNDLKQKTKTLRLSYYKKTWDQCTQVKESKKWYASSKATDGMQYKHGVGMMQKSGRHITNTYSWEQANTTTNTVLELCWTRSGGKELLILNTSTNGHHRHGRGKPPTHQTDECVLHPLGICRPSHRKHVQKDREAHDKLQKIHTFCGRRLQCRTGTWSWNRMHKCCQIHTQRGKQKRWLDETFGWCYKDTQHSTRCTEKTPQKQTISPKGNEKQIDYMLKKRRYLKYNKDAEANDMIHMGSNHRCVMATFTITTPGKSSHYKTIKGKHDIIKHEGRDQTGKTLKLRSLSSKKDTKRSSKKSKEKPPPQKKQQRKQKAKMQKHKQKKWEWSSRRKKWTYWSGRRRSRRNMHRNHGEW